MSLDPLVQSTLVSGAITIFGLGLGYFINRRGNNASADSSEASAVLANAEATLKLIPALNDRITQLTSEAKARVETHKLELAEREKQDEARDQQINDQAKVIVSLLAKDKKRDAQVEGMRAGMIVLVSQLTELGYTPRYTPPPAEIPEDGQPAT